MATLLLSITLGVSQRHPDTHPLVALSYLPNICLAAYALARDVSHRPGSLHLMHLIFLFLFLGVAPLCQYLTATFPWQSWAPEIRSTHVLEGNFAVFLWTLAYLTAYKLPAARTPSAPLPSPLNRPVTHTGLILATAISLLALAYLASQGLAFKWTRAAAAETVMPRQTTYDLLITYPLRCIPYTTLAALLLFCAHQPPQTKGPYALAIFLLAVGNLICNNPFAAARYWTASIVLALLWIVIFRHRRSGLGLFFLALLGALVLLPVLEIGRTETDPRVLLLSIKDLSSLVRLSVDQLFSAHMDAYANLLYALRYIDESGITWGRQLLGVLLFFVPRALWSTKPVGTGFLVAEHYGSPFTNISMPLIGEAALNFGWLGIPAFAALFARLLRLLEAPLYTNTPTAHSSGQFVTLLTVIAPFWLGLAFFMSRGDLLSSFAYAIGLTFTALPLAVGPLPANNPVMRIALRRARSPRYRTNTKSHC